MSQFLSLGGNVFNAFGAYEESQSTAESLEKEAKTQDQNAALARQHGSYNASIEQTKATQKFGEMGAGYAASGVTSDSSSVLDVLRQAHANAEMDRLNILHGAEIQAVNAENRASSARFGAGQVRSAGRLNAFSALFSGGGKAYSMYGNGGGSSNNVNDYSGGSSSSGSSGNSAGDSYTNFGSYA